MKMVIAIDNIQITQRIIKKYKDKFYIEIFGTKEEILSNLVPNEDNLIIVREDLKGKLDFIELITCIKQINSNNRIIAIVNELTKELKEKLFSREIFNVIEGKNFLFEELIENIDNPKLVIYKDKRKVINKSKIIIITGSNNAGKTLFAKILSNKIARNKSKNILVLDFNFIHPCLDLYINCNRNYSLISLIEDFKINAVKQIACYESVDTKYSNIKYIFNCKSIATPSGQTLIKLLEYLQGFYDYILVDTSSNNLSQMCFIAQEIKANIIYILEASIKSAREYMLDTIFLPKEQINSLKFVINKCRNKKIIKQVVKLTNINLLGYIKWTSLINLYINKDIKIILKYKMQGLLKRLGVIKFEKVKLKLIEKILNIEEE